MLPVLLITAAVVGLSESSSTSRRRARLNELKNRLGLVSREDKSDLRTRLLWIKERYGLEAFRRVVRVIRDLEDDKSWGPEDFSDIVDVRMPPLGFRSYYEPMVPWLGREAARSFIADRGGGPLPSLLDWYESEHPDLMSMSWAEATDASDEWHKQFIGQDEYKKPSHKAVTVASWPDGATLQRITTEAQLDSEGTSMGHCVGGYWSDVRDDRSIILSYRDPDGVPQATLEIKIQAVGPIKDSSTSVPFIVQAKARDDVPVTDGKVRNRLGYFVLNWQMNPGELGASIDPSIPDEVVALAGAKTVTVEMEKAVEAVAPKFLYALREVEYRAGDIQQANEYLEALYRIGERPSREAAVKAWLDAIREAAENHGQGPDRIDEDFDIKNEQSFIYEVVLSEAWSDLWKAADREADLIDTMLRESGWTLDRAKGREDRHHGCDMIWELHHLAADNAIRDPEYVAWLRALDYENLPGWGNDDFESWDKNHRRTSGYDSRESLLDSLVNHGPIYSYSQAKKNLEKDVEGPGKVDFTRDEVLGPIVPFLQAARAKGVEMTRDSKRTLERLERLIAEGKR